jgi:threonine dehydratase
VAESEPEGDETALAHAADHGAVDAEPVEQSREVLGRVPVAEGLGRRDRGAMSALVPGDDSVPPAQRVDLRQKHLVVHQEAVAEDDRYTAAAAVLVIDALPAELGDRHGRSLYPVAVAQLSEPVFADILDAARQIRPYISPTPLRRYPALDRLVGAEVYVKHENHNPTGAFKVRGGVNLVSRLSEDERTRGVIAASTGNHGQSVAYAARLFEVSAIIVAPAAANPVKVESMQDLGAEVVLEGERYDDSRDHAERLAREHGYRYIHSGDEPLLIAGVGTHTLEVLQEQPHVDTVIVPVGGGSGAAGAAVAAKAVNPAIQVIGVQSDAAQSAFLSWKSGKLQDSPNRTRVEGLSTARPFELPQRTMRRLLDDFVLVSDDEIDAATAVMIEKTRTLVEAAGAAALAAAMKLRSRLAGRSVALICSGGNISPAQLKALLAR